MFLSTIGNWFCNFNRTTLTQCHRLDCLQTQVYCFTIPEARNPKPGADGGVVAELVDFNNSEGRDLLQVLFIGLLMAVSSL